MPEITLQLLRACADAEGPREFHLAAESLRHALIQVGVEECTLRPDRRSLALGVVAFRNGRDVRYAGGIEAPLAPGDRLLVVPPATDS